MILAKNHGFYETDAQSAQKLEQVKVIIENKYEKLENDSDESDTVMMISFTLALLKHCL